MNTWGKGCFVVVWACVLGCVPGDAAVDDEDQNSSGTSASTVVWANGSGGGTTLPGDDTTSGGTSGGTGGTTGTLTTVTEPTHPTGTTGTDALCDASGGGTQDPSLALLECDVLDVGNQVRAVGADCGVYGWYDPAPPLSMEENLRVAARVHSTWMSDTGEFSHDSPGGPLGDDMVERIENAGYTPWMLVAENIAWGYPTPEAVIDGWVESDGHCANLMNPDLAEIGIGIADGGGLYWTQDFGTQM
jgi:uncharacterized protein YkwD